MSRTVSNLSILDQNILAGLSPASQDYYLKQRDAIGPRAAERAAWDWEVINSFLAFALPKAASLYGEKADHVAPDLIRFFEVRALNFHRAAAKGAK